MSWSPLLAFGLVILPAPAHAQATLIGIVRDDSTSAPLAGVEVLINGTNHRTETNTQGRYTLAGLPAGVYAVTYRLVGYLPTRVDVRLNTGDTTRANPVMIRSAIVLDSVVVTGATEPTRGVGIGREAFDERRRRGFGRFIDTEEIRRLEGNLHLDDLLRRHGIEMHRVRIDGTWAWMAFNSFRRDIGGRLNCRMEVYYNGVVVVTGGIVGMSSGRAIDLRSYLLSGLDAVEVYRSAGEVPAEYGGANAACGVILLWSRVGS